MSDGSLTTEWIAPPDPNVVADYWLTRRDVDAAPGYEVGQDVRVRYRWNGKDAWITLRYESPAGKMGVLTRLYAKSGWRVEGPAPA